MEKTVRGGRNLFGDFVKNRRKELRITLRRFCLETGVDPGNFSKIERGILPPPKDKETLTKWALNLGFEEDSPEWKEYFDLAAISKGRLPEDIVTDEELAQSLPLIFRTIRGDKISDEQFETLKNLIRETLSGH